MAIVENVQSVLPEDKDAPLLLAASLESRSFPARTRQLLEIQFVSKGQDLSISMAVTEAIRPASVLGSDLS